jgi:hypothetical protein
MKKYFCHRCSAARKYLEAIRSDSLLQSPYQLGNYMKHTVPNAKSDVLSVFSSTSTSAFESYVINSKTAGSVEIDERGRANIIWVAGKDIGLKYVRGQVVGPEDAVKVVLSTSTGRIHAYPQSSKQFLPEVCADCGKWAIR